MSAISLHCATGAAIEPYLADLARLRIHVFRHWPYLYEGSVDYEMQYLTTYLRTPRSICVMAQVDNEIVGASTGLPLSDETAEFQGPFLSAGWDITRIFYFGESVLLPEYRSQGIGHEFFNYRERHAASFGCFTHTAFAAVDRPLEHPLRPLDYREHNEFWHKRGYSRANNLTMRLSWPEVGQTQPTEKPLTFWLRPNVLTAS